MKIAKVLFVLALLTAAAASAFAQATTGALLGTVVDSSHAVVAGAKITVTYKDTRATRTAASDSEGAFEFPGLLPGAYSVEVAANGFQSVKLDNIALSATEKRNLGTLVLEIGAVTQTINVTAEVTPIQTASSDRGQTIDSASIGLKGRDISSSWSVWSRA